jgi:polyhydroxyalkanoate synthase
MKDLEAVPDLLYGLAMGSRDPASIGQAMSNAWLATLREPAGFLRAWAGLTLSQATIATHALQRAFGAEPQPVVEPAPGDRRFTDRAWQTNPWLRAIMESYLASSRWTLDMMRAADVPAETRRKAGFGTGLLVNALAPTNLPWLNPTVAKEAIDTGGLSLVKGMRNFVDDAVRNNGRPRQVDTSPFELGRNLAATPGRIVYRNDLIELIAYEPQTDRVFARPLLFSPPWINKYYVMDLAPGRSLIEYAVQQGFRSYCISYRNPDASMSGVTMDDYLRHGLLAAFDRVAEITAADAVNVFGLCLGGTLEGILLGWLAAHGQSDRVGWAAFTNSLLDFSEPGELGVFTDLPTVERIERRMRRTGFLDATEMAGTFDWMRDNDLVWNYVIANWFMGKQPPAFDILAWNSDSTNMPATMHSQYLRSCYIDNSLARGQMTVADTRIDLDAVRTPIYVIGAEADHIAPWRAAYRTTQLLGGPARFTLTSSGHIAGIVNPPGGRTRHWTSELEDLPSDPDEWRATAQENPGTWWGDWAAWASARSGEKVAARKLPPGEVAPGRYVRGELGPPIPGQRRRRPARTAGN